MKSSPFRFAPSPRKAMAACVVVTCLTAIAADVEYTYDENGRLTGVFAPNGDAAQYVYDPAGNILAINRLNAGTLGIVEFSPKKGPVGTVVTIRGNGFNVTPSLNAVSFNGTAATVTSATATRLVAAVPSGATTGAISVTVGGSTVNTTSPFTVTNGTPCASRVTGFTPSIGAAGSAVTISGGPFSASNLVLINQVPAPIQNATSSSLTVTVPSGASSGRLVVSMPPDCDPIVAGDFFVPPAGVAASDIGVTGRLVINGLAVTPTLAANKKALYVFDASPAQATGLYVTGSTLSSVNADFRGPDGAVITSGSMNGTSWTLGPTVFRMAGGFSAYLAPVFGTAGSATLQLGGPDLTVTSAAINGAVTENQNGSFTVPVTYTVSNIGTITAQPNWYDYLYISSGVALEPTSPILGSVFRNTAVAPSGSYTVTQSFTVSGVQPGTYKMFAMADSRGGRTADQGYMLEPNETNNFSSAVTVVLPAYPDLAITSFSVGGITENQSGTYNIPVSFTVTNQSTTAAQPSWNDYGYLSSNGSLDASSTQLGANVRSTALAGGANYTINRTYVTGVTAPGNYKLFLKADGVTGAQTAGPGVVVEGNEANNVVAYDIVLPSYPDLAISNAVLGSITENQNGTFYIPVTFTVTNLTSTPAQASWTDYGYLSSNGQLDASSVAMSANQRNTTLAGSASYNVSKTFISSAAPGTYTLFLKTDGLTGSGASGPGAVAEGNEANNVTSLPVTLPTYPDLAVSNVVVGNIVNNGNGTYNIPVSYTVTNLGTTTAQPSWLDYGYLSRNGVLDSATTALGYTNHTTSLAGGASYNVNQTYVVSGFTAGTYTLFVKADGQSGSLTTGPGVVVESSETNNASGGSSVTLP